MKIELNEIRNILNKDWDPIAGSSSDEYDSYADHVYSMLQYEGVTSEEIADYLETVEREHMGLEGDRGRAENIAKKLLD